MNNPKLIKTIRCIPDFPKPGIQLYDEVTEMYKDKGITKIVGIESRGFLLASAIALKLNAGVAICRKKGKLPGKVVEENFEKEYGKDTVCMTEDSITSDDVVLIHDDLLATGGSLKAAYDLVQRFHPKKVYINVIIELTIEGLQGRQLLEKFADVTALIRI